MSLRVYASACIVELLVMRRCSMLQLLELLVNGASPPSGSEQVIFIYL